MDHADEKSQKHILRRKFKETREMWKCLQKSQGCQEMIKSTIPVEPQEIEIQMVQYKK